MTSVPRGALNTFGLRDSERSTRSDPERDRVVVCQVFGSKNESACFFLVSL